MPPNVSKSLMMRRFPSSSSSTQISPSFSSLSSFWTSFIPSLFQYCRWLFVVDRRRIFFHVFLFVVLLFGLCTNWSSAVLLFISSLFVEFAVACKRNGYSWLSWKNGSNKYRKKISTFKSVGLHSFLFLMQWQLLLFWEGQELGFSIQDFRMIRRGETRISPLSSFLGDVSIIIPVRDEEEYIVRTLKYTFEVTPASFIREVIIVDDYSQKPVAEVLDRDLPKAIRDKVRIIKLDSKEGLIRARIAGAREAVADVLFFMDGHCRPKSGWLEPLLRHLKINERRVACPVIQDIHPETWKDTGTFGLKMMFDWTFEFMWYDDESEEVPLSAGGIFAINKKWWFESGEYDAGMLEWGAENIEHSIRMWTCGGEIYVARDSHMGHIFDRPPKPNPGNRLIIQVQKNQKRAALVWLDDYYKYVEQFHPVVKTLDEGGLLNERKELRKKLNCKPFQWYVDRFKTAFQRKGLLISDFRLIRNTQSQMCLTNGNVVPWRKDVSELNDQGQPRMSSRKVGLAVCRKDDYNQFWQIVAGNRMIYNLGGKNCLQKIVTETGGTELLTAECEWMRVFRTESEGEFWQFDEGDSGRIFSFESDMYRTVTGNDIYPIQKEEAYVERNICLKFEEEIQGREGGGVEADVKIRPCSPKTEMDESFQFEAMIIE